MHGQGSVKRQQSNGAAALEGGPAAGTAASVLDTAQQLAFPVAASSSAPAAQNLRAAVGAAQADAEQQPSLAPACNGIAADMQHSDVLVPVSGHTAPAALAQNGEAQAPSETPALPGTSQGTDPAGAALAAIPGRASEPNAGNASMQPQPESTAPQGSSARCGHDAEQTPSSAALGPDAGKRQLQGLPTPTGSHSRFESDDDGELPRAAAELEDSEVIAQLQFMADARGQLVISFNGRSIVEPSEPGKERGQSHGQAGSRKRDTPTKAQRQWCAHFLLLRQFLCCLLLR